MAERYTNRKRDLLQRLKQVNMAMDLTASLRQKGGYAESGIAYFQLGEVKRTILREIEAENMLIDGGSAYCNRCEAEHLPGQHLPIGTLLGR